MSKTAFLTGVSGFVGANLARLLLERGYRVRALIRPTSEKRYLPVNPAFETVVGDLRDPSSFAAALKGCEEVYHVAADYRFWALDSTELYDSNVRGTRNFLTAAGNAGVKKIIYTSTVGTIGLSRQPQPCDEETAQDPGQLTSHYKRSKLEAEKVALEFAQKGLPIVIVNPSTPIGAWDQKPTPTGKIIVDFVNGKMPAYVDTGLNFVDVRDVAEGHLLAAQKGRIGERYILGGRNLPMIDFLDLIAKMASEIGIEGCPKQGPRIRIPYRLAWLTGAVSTAWANHVTRREPAVALEAVKMSQRYLFFDSSKASRELGIPQTPIEKPIRDALQWFRAHGYFQFAQERKMYVNSR